MRSVQPRVYPPEQKLRSTANVASLPAPFCRSFAGFGIVDIDWSNGKAVWKNAQPQNCEENMAAQVSQLHAADPTTKVWTYKNLVKVGAGAPFRVAVRRISVIFRHMRARGCPRSAGAPMDDGRAREAGGPGLLGIRE